MFFFLMFLAMILASFIIMLIILSLGLRGLGQGYFIGPSGPKVGVVELSGMIRDSEWVVSSIKRFREDSSVKAIVLRIDSPGGGVGASQEIYREVKKTVGVKPVMSSLGAVAASGGYYVASASTGIMANPGTITGSIGVIIAYTNFEKLLEKIGLAPVVIKSGEFKDIGSPARTMTDREKRFLENFVKNIHSQFVSAVAAGRKIPREDVERIADGRIYSGEDARQLGLVDKLGNFEDSIEWAGRKGGITGEITVVYAKKKRHPLVEWLTESITEKLSEKLTDNIQAGYLYSPSR